MRVSRRFWTNRSTLALRPTHGCSRCYNRTAWTASFWTLIVGRSSCNSGSSRTWTGDSLRCFIRLPTSRCAQSSDDSSSFSLLFFNHPFYFPALLVGGFTLSDLPDKPWSHVSCFLPPCTCHYFFVAHWVEYGVVSLFGGIAFRTAVSGFVPKPRPQC